MIAGAAARWASALAFGMGVAGAPAVAQQQPAGSEPDGRPPFSIVRQEERWDFLKDPARRTDPFDAAKYIPLDESGDTYLYTGLDVRLQDRDYRNEQWGTFPGRDASLRIRIMPHLGLVAGDRFRAFVALRYGEIVGRAFPAPPTERDRLDLHQAFLELGFGDAFGGQTQDAIARLGRQELHYGSGRMVSVREGPTVRQSFDGGLVRVKRNGWTADALAVYPVADRPGTFDNETDSDQPLWGIFASGPLGGDHKLDLYYFGVRRPDSVYQAGTGRELRHTIGARWSYQSGRWTADLEGALQFGRYREVGQPSADIRAWTISSAVKYSVSNRGWQPAVGLDWGFASGDGSASDRRLGTFRAPYPPGNYFGEANPLGPGNLAGFRPFVEVQPVPKLTVTPQSYLFWRMSDGDAIYGPPGNLLRRGDRSGAMFVGVEPGVRLQYALDRHITIGATYAHFFAGRFLEQTPPGRDIDFLEARIEFKF